MEKEKLSSEILDSPLDRLLQLVEEDNPDTILAEEKLVATFNELLKYGLIELQDEKIYLTPKGKLAKNEGVENFINNLKQIQAQNEPKNQQKRTAVIKPFFLTVNRKLWSLSLLFLLVLAMVFSLLNLFG